jgi:hypothetical protein
MELEQRVKALEYEIKILKNEIQRTLLDIHEQVLVHYYPTLRLDENEVPAPVIQAIEAARAKLPVRSPAAAAVEPAVTPAESVAPPAVPVVPATPEDTPAPAVKKVSLGEIRAAREVAPAAPAGDPQANLIKLVEWAVNSTTKFGHERTTQLIDALNKKGIVDRATKNALFQIIALNKSAEPAQVVVNDILDELLKFDKLVGRTADAEEALTLIEEAGLG